MKAKTSSVQDILFTNRIISMFTVFNTTWAIVKIPTWICAKTNWNLHYTRIGTFVILMMLADVFLKSLNKASLDKYNELLEKDVYEIQQSLKDNGRIDVEDIDVAIDMLNTIKGAVPPTASNPTTEEPKKDN